jgi:alpha-beta hydrolase superfamily lysophospholipase
MEGVMLKQYKDISYRDWVVNDAKASVLMVHGMGAHSERFLELALKFNKEKINCYAIALQGFGELTGDKKGHVRSVTEYHKAIKMLKEVIISENKDKPIFILGESMGGLLATTHLLNYDNNYKGLVVVVPAYSDVFKLNLLDRAKILMYSLFTPSKAILMPFTTEQLSRDPEIIAKLNADSREHRFASAGLLRELLFQQVDVAMNLGKLKVPVLMLSAGKDMLVSTPAGEQLFKKIKSDKKYVLYPESLHALTIEKNRDEVHSEIINWVKAKV